IARASALERVGRAPSPGPLDVRREGLKDGNPLVRRAAAGSLEGVDPALRGELLAPLLVDPVREVRMEAARALAGVPTDRVTGAQRPAVERGLGEYMAAQEFNADRPESHLNLGLLYAAQRRADAAEAQLREALAIDARFAPAAVNLADLYRATGRDGEGERVLRELLERDPRSAAAHHA